MNKLIKAGQSPSRKNLPTRPWYTYKTDRVSAQLYSWCLANEYYSYRRRYRNMTLYRLVTGEEPPVVLGLWMSKRVATTLLGYDSSFVFPQRNIIQSACDTLENRIGTTRPFVQTLPRMTDFATRETCRDIDLFVDGIFEKEKYYDTLRLCFRDAFTWGMGIAKVTAFDQSDDRRVAIERCLPDEILVDELATVVSPPRFMVQRRYMSRYDAISAYAEGRPEVEAAIRIAQSAFIGITGIRYEHDMICMLEGWKLPDPDGSYGRHVLCCGNEAIVDEAYDKDYFPFAVMRWSPQTLGWRSVGGAFHMAPVQIEVNTKWEQILDAQRAMAYPRWLVAKGSDVTAKTMGARPGAIHFYTGVEPKPIVPLAANAEMYEDAIRWENFGYSIVGITQQQVQGAKQPGVNSGVALRLMVDVEDARNKSRVMAMEDFTREIACLVIDAAEECKPIVVIGERKLNWNDVFARISANAYEVRSFPISSLPSTPEGQQQTISEWYADGVVDRRAYFRLQQIPDTAGFARMTTASADLVESQLDTIVKTGCAVSPEPTLEDYAAALTQAKARYNLEKRLRAENKTLRAMQKYIALLSQQIPAAAPSMGAPAAPPVPSQIQGAGAPIAPPQVQVASSLPAAA